MSASFSLRKTHRGNSFHPYQPPATHPARSFLAQQSTYPLAYQSHLNRIDSPQSSFYYSSQNSHWRPPVQPLILSLISAFVQQNVQWKPPVQHSIPPPFFAHPSTQAPIRPHFKTPFQSRSNFPNRSLHHSSQIRPLKFHQTVQTKQNPNCSSPKTSTSVSSTPVERKSNNSVIERVQFPPPDIELVVKDALKTFNDTQNCTNPYKRKRKKKSRKNKVIAQATSSKKNEKEKEEKVDLYKKHMVKDPWMNMKPVVGFIVKQWAHHDSTFEEEKRNILKNKEEKWKCEGGFNFKVESEMSLADCLEVSFEEALNGM